MKKILFVTLALGLIGLVWWLAPAGIGLRSQVLDDTTVAQQYDPLKFLLGFGSPGIRSTSTLQFLKPRAVAVDKSGNVYVADTGNKRIQKFDASGKLLLKFGEGLNYRKAGTFISPNDIVVDSNGYIYVLDQSYRVEKFDANGKFLFEFSSYGTNDQNLSSIPKALALDSKGNIAVLDTKLYIYEVTSNGTRSRGVNDRINRFDPTGKYLGTIELENFFGKNFAFDSGDNIYVTSGDDSNVQKFDATGKPLMKFGSQGTGDGQFQISTDIALDTSGNIFIADGAYGARIQKFDPSGKFMMKFGSQGTGDGQFSSLQDTGLGVTIDTSGNIYIPDTNNGRIQKFDADGKFLAKYGETGSGSSDDAAEGKMDKPGDTAVDTSHNVYILDVGNHRVQKFSSDGKFLLQFGSKGSGDGQLMNPSDIDVAKNGDISVVDQGNKRIEIFDSSGKYKSQFTLKRFQNYKYDNQLLEAPSLITIDQLGNSYISDSAHNTIQKFDANGQFLLYFIVPHVLDMATDRYGNIYAICNQTGVKQIQKFDADGKLLVGFDVIGKDGENLRPTNIILDKNDNLYILHNKRVVTSSGGSYTSGELSQIDLSGKLLTTLSLFPGKTTYSSYISIDPEENTLYSTDIEGWDYRYGSERTMFIKKFSLELNPITTYTLQMFRDSAMTDEVDDGSKIDSGIYTLKITANEPLKDGYISVDTEGKLNDVTRYQLTRISDTEWSYQYPVYADIDSTGSSPIVFSLQATDKFNLNNSGPLAPQKPRTIFTDTKLHSMVLTQTFGSAGWPQKSIYSPRSIALDLTGNIFVTDDDQVQIFDANGKFLRPMNQEQYSYGRGGRINFGADGYLYKSKGYPYESLWKIDVAGRLLVQILPTMKIYNPGQIVTDSKGSIFVPDISNNRIIKADASGAFLSTFGKKGTGNGEFQEPYSMVIDSSGNIYVTDTLNKRIQKFDADGKFLSIFAPGTAFLRPIYITLNNAGNIVVVDSVKNSLFTFDSTGKLLSEWGKPGKEDGQLNKPIQVVFDRNNNFYIADEQRVQKFDANGKFLTKFGTASTTGFIPAEEGKFMANGLTTDTSGNIYVDDAENQRIQKFDANGKFITTFGNNHKFGAIGINGSNNIYGWSPPSMYKFDTNGVLLSKFDDSTQKQEASDIDIDKNDNIYLLPKNPLYALKYSSSGTAMGSIKLAGLTGFPIDNYGDKYTMALDSSGNIYALVRNNDGGKMVTSVQKFDATGKPLLTLNLPLTEISRTNFSYSDLYVRTNAPVNIDIDGEDALYVFFKSPPDITTDKIIKYDKNGKLIAIIPLPLGNRLMHLDIQGNIYMTDGSHILTFKRTTPGSTISTTRSDCDASWLASHASEYDTAKSNLTIINNYITVNTCDSDAGKSTVEIAACQRKITLRNKKKSLVDKYENCQKSLQ